MRRILAVVVAIAAVVVWFSVFSLGRALDDVISRASYTIEGGDPVTMYFPDGGDEDGYGRGKRPPVVIAGHGFSGDRREFNTFANALVEHGFAVITFDFRGHGANNRPFAGSLTDDFVAVMDEIRGSRWFDDKRIALLGHSMG